MQPIYIGFMRLITLNFKLMAKPTELGWKKDTTHNTHNMNRKEATKNGNN